MGVHNGLFCTGCCWALMLLLFVSGVMDLRWIIALTFFSLIEKTSPLSPRMTAYAVGTVLIGMGIAQLF
jgi:predicted metal-binding membrane protein